MTRETSYSDNRYTYRIAPTDARTIQRKANVPYSRWLFYLRRDTANEAKAALIQLGKGGVAGEKVQP